MASSFCAAFFANRTPQPANQHRLTADSEDHACGLHTHHANLQLLFRFPTDGKYFIHLADTQRHGGLEYGYRLRLSAPQPDFELSAVPASLTLRPGDRAPVRIVVLRQEGFTNEITITLKDAPAGFKPVDALPPARTKPRSC